jgi:NADH:ubiquinone oxidoreductase subunit 2 (subunit N)
MALNFVCYSASLAVVVLSLSPAGDWAVYRDKTQGGIKALSLSGCVGLLSLAGLPPTLGFAGKLIATYCILGEGRTRVLGVLIPSSGVLLFLYLRLALTTLGGGFLERESPALEKAGGPIFLLRPILVLPFILRVSSNYTKF